MEIELIQEALIDVAPIVAKVGLGVAIFVAVLAFVVFYAPQIGKI